MQQLVNTLKSPGLHLLLFFFFFALLGWPILTIIEKAGNSSIFFYTFSVWGFIIIFLYVIALSLGSAGRKKTGNTAPGR